MNISSRLTRLTALLALVALLLAAAGLAACGGGGSGENVDKVLNETFGGKRKINSGRLNMRITADLKGVQQLSKPVTVTIAGPFESRGNNQVPKLDLNLSTGTGAQGFKAGVISTGDRGYVNFQGNDYAVPAKTFDQFKQELRKQKQQDSGQPDLAGLGVDPRKWLENPSDEGTEDVGGVKTIHISSGVNVSKLLDDLNAVLKRTGQLGLSAAQRRQLPSSIAPSVKKQITQSVKKAKIDVFTGKQDKTLRKLDAKLEFDVPANLRTQTSGVSSGKVGFTVVVTEVNKPQQIKAPANARPLSELQQQLRTLGGVGSLGGASGSGSSGSLGSQGTTGGAGGSSGGGSSSSGTNLGSGGGAATGSTPKARKYLKCLQNASGAQEIQACANLLR